MTADSSDRSAANDFILPDMNLFNILPMSAGIASRPGPEAATRPPKPRRPASGTADASEVSGSSRPPKQPRPEKYKRSGLSSGSTADPVFVLPPRLLSGVPMDHPFNRDMFRYTLAEPDPVLNPHLVAYREREIEPGVFVSREDRSSLIALSRDRLNITTEKGFRLARATHSVSEGEWFFEVFVGLSEAESAHCRLGWARREGNFFVACRLPELKVL